jgi:hypothetical protein
MRYDQEHQKSLAAQIFPVTSEQHYTGKAEWKQHNAAA